MTRATPGDRIRITVDEEGAPLGALVTVKFVVEDGVFYDYKGYKLPLSFGSTHDCYEVVGA